MRFALLVLASSCDAKRWRTSLVEGYQVEFKFIAKFAFNAATEDDPGRIFLNAWTFMPGQRVLLYRNDKWFNAYDPVPRGLPTSCQSRAVLADSTINVRKGDFYGQAGQVMSAHGPQITGRQAQAGSS